MAQKKNAAAVELGRLGGLVRVPKGLATMDAEQAREIRSAGGRARWKNHKPGGNKAEMARAVRV